MSKNDLLKNSTQYTAHDSIEKKTWQRVGLRLLRYVDSYSWMTWSGDNSV